MKGAKPAGPELEEGPGRAGKATGTIQSESMTRGASQEGKGELSGGIEERWEAQWQNFLRTLQPLHTGWGSPGMPEAAPWEDTKAFLASFEQVAKACRWPRGEWAARLLPALSGEAEEAFRSLEAREQEDYGKVKAAILRGEALRMEVQRQHFRQFCCQEVEDPRRIHSQLQELCRQWLKPERHSKEQILELLILEQFLASLPVGLQGWIRAGGPDTCSQAVALAEDFLMSQHVAVAAAWQEPRKEEFEEPSDPVKGHFYEEPEQNGSGIKSPNFAKSSLLPEVQKTDQTDVKEEGDILEEMNLHGSSLCLQIVSPSLPQTAQQTTVWQVLQEDGENVESLGVRKGSKVKMENCQDGGNEPQEMSGKASQISQVNVVETAEIHGEGCKSKKGQETEPVGREKECHELTEDLTAAISPPSNVRRRDNMPMFSKYGRRYCYKLEPDMIDPRDDHEECLMSDENLQRNPCFDQYHQTRKSEFSENGKEGNLNRHQIYHPEENHEQLHTAKKKREGPESEEIFTRHKENYTRLKPYKCSQCGGCFSERRGLRRHQGIHSGEKPFKCSQCGRCFRERAKLKAHQRIHSGEKPFKCLECGKSFRWIENLKPHQRIHSAEKPYKCFQCGSCFRERYGLRSHQRIHSGEKPFKCLECGQSFRWTKSLRAHQRIHS